METIRTDRCCLANRFVRERRFPQLLTRPRAKHLERNGGRGKAMPDLLENYGSVLLASHPGWPVGFAANTLVFVSGIRVLLSGLTWTGVLHSWFLGSSIYAAFGPGGYLLVCLYFLLGSLATKVKLEEKTAAGIAEQRSGRRSIGSVWGSGFAGVACALLALTTGDYAFYQIGFVASFGSKLADTVSSEIGKAYGEATFLITNLEGCPRGTEGAVSVEGTAAGMATAMGYSILAFLLHQISIDGIWLVFGSCVVSNFAESYIGATIQGKVEWLTNDTVNIIQISMASLLAIYTQQLLLQA